MEIHIDLEDEDRERPVLDSLEYVLDEIDGIRGYDYANRPELADIVVEVELEHGAAGTPLAGVETFKDRLSRRLDEWAENEPDVSDISIS